MNATPINPAVVRTPDGRLGTLFARYQMRGCVRFCMDGSIYTYPLTVHDYHITAAPERPGQIRRA